MTMNLDNVVKNAARGITQRRRAIRRTFRPPSDKMYILSPEEQVRRFLSLTTEDLEAIRRQRGTTELMRYVTAQLENLRALRNGTI